LQIDSNLETSKFSQEYGRMANDKFTTEQINSLRGRPSDVVLQTGLGLKTGLKTIFKVLFLAKAVLILAAWTVLRLWKITVVRPNSLKRP